MKILDKVLGKLAKKLEKREAKRKQKLLIKTDDDQFVADALPSDEDNSAIDIQKVVEHMESPEMMAEVVKNNLGEIIEQDNVRNTLQHLDDETVETILNENKEVLRKQAKMKFAIEAIGSNEKKLKSIFKNMKNLTDIELAQLLNGLQEDGTEEQQKSLEEQKIKAVSMKILEHMIKHGAAWHLEELTNCLQEDSKLSVLNLCLGTIHDYEKDKDKTLGSKAKTKLTLDLLRTAEVDSQVKFELLDENVKNGFLSKEECEEVKIQMEKERLELEEEQRQKMARAKSRD